MPSAPASSTSPRPTSLADRQWALKNNGRIRRTESRLNLDSLDHMYVHKDDGGDVDAVALPPVGPGNYDKINTDAVEGIDINILPAWDLYETVETKRPVTVAIMIPVSTLPIRI